MNTRLLITRESYRFTALLWLIVPLLGAVPYLAAGVVPSFTDALFESVSGFTTTGSSVILSPESLPAWLRMWRALTQWVGGLGLVLFIVAFVPSLRGGSSQLYAAEFSGTQQRKLHPHMSRNVARMWGIYTLMTLLCTAALYATDKRNVFDSVCLAMSTVSTGGFMPASGGMAGYGTGTMMVLTLFMFLSGVNVAMLYNLFTFHWRRLRRSSEFVVYAVLFVLAAAVCTVAFAAKGAPWDTAARYSLFHIASTVSTCGFYTATPPEWPFVASVVTFLLILSGAMAGSTGGGLKLRRLMTLFLYLRNYFSRMLHPNVVFAIKIDNQVVPAEYVNKIFGFVFLYILFITGGAFALTLTGSDMADAFCLATANISNLGPTPIIGSIGADFSYTLLPSAAKWVLMVLMLAGRLEIFALLAIVSPSYWSRR
ncbi:MAG: TrkH family potassium uptake protein [Bacteroidales bacterium]|nr:TrkH family potassium uptake protein [Bacteroidales bacterium]